MQLNPRLAAYRGIPARVLIAFAAVMALLAVAPPKADAAPKTQSFWGNTSNIKAAPPGFVKVKFLNRTNHNFHDSQVYWQHAFTGQNGEKHYGKVYSLAKHPSFNAPRGGSQQIYFYLGSAKKYNDFIEFSSDKDGFHVNTTRVDRFGLKLAIRLHGHDGYDKQAGENQTTFHEKRAQLFKEFNNLPSQFKHLAKFPDGITAPHNDPAFLNGRYSTYFKSYAQQVGVKASTADIFTCGGILANVENHDLCAALNRHVAGLPKSKWSDKKLYYKAHPANYYAKFWHDHAINHAAYGFPNDDSTDQSSYLSDPKPQYLLVAIGW